MYYTFRGNKNSIKELSLNQSSPEAEDVELIIMVYYSGCTMKKYAEEKGISYITGIRRKNRILSKLRGKLEMRN